jgi:hypothetical protein
MTMLEDAQTLAATRLRERAENVDSVLFGPEVQRDFTLTEIEGGAAKTGVADWLMNEIWPYPQNQPAIYVISASNPDCAAAIANAFKARKLNFAAPRENPANGGSTALYVGSSEKIKTRLKEHLFQAYSEKTYALNLQKWCPQIEGSIRVKIQPILDSSSREIRQDLEDAVWRKFSPIFGKSGGR